jgi:hypothetical protein
MTWEEAAAGMAEVTIAPGAVGRVGIAAGRAAVGWAPWTNSGRFDSFAFNTYSRFVGVEWNRRGRFEGVPTVEAAGGREYVFRPTPAAPFAFVRHTGERIEPGRMRTDGGSVPRPAWVIPGVDPWVWMPAYLIHDWLFMLHHCRPDAVPSYGFDAANRVLAEGVFTLMMDGHGAEDWRICEVIYRAVSSPAGRRVWSAPWDGASCADVIG